MTDLNRIKFESEEHKEFFVNYVPKCRCDDVYHIALIYCLGISRDTRAHVKEIYDFKSGNVKPECLDSAWQTSGSRKVVRLAFNLYCNSTPSVGYMEDAGESMEEQLYECERYTVEEIFCCSYARYFWEAIKLRYPEYCNN